MVRFLVGVVVAMLLNSCSTLPHRAPTAPTPPVSTSVGWLTPNQTLPGRMSPATPEAPLSSVSLVWVLPATDPPVLEPAVRVALLPLPEVAQMPIQSSPSLPRVTIRATPPIVLRPVPVTALAAPVQPKATRPVVAVPLTPAVKSAVAAATPPVPTVPSLLPGATNQAQDFAWSDTNVIIGEPLALQFPKTNWLYLDSPTQQKILGYQTTTRDKESTTFAFKPSSQGQYILEFQRQDLTSGATEVRHVRVKVASATTRTSSTGSVLTPQTSTGPSADALESSKKLAAAGKTAEAVQKLLQNYKEQDTRTNLEIARLLELGNQPDDALGYLDKNLTLDTPDFRDSLVLGTRLAAAQNSAQKLPTYVKQWLLSPVAPPEDTYLSVLGSLRELKLPTLSKDWMRLYDTWYKAPVSRDQFLYLCGNLLESPGELLNIKEAYKAYSEVVAKYPLSPWWKAAGERASYLNRHFLQVR